MTSTGLTETSVEESTPASPVDSARAARHRFAIDVSGTAVAETVVGLLAFVAPFVTQVDQLSTAIPQAITDAKHNSTLRRLDLAKVDSAHIG